MTAPKLTKAQRRAKECIRAAKSHWGHAWTNLTDDMRDAFVSRELLKLVVGQDEDSASPAIKRVQEVAAAAFAELRGPMGDFPGEAK